MVKKGLSKLITISILFFAFSATMVVGSSALSSLTEIAFGVSIKTEQIFAVILLIFITSLLIGFGISIYKMMMKVN